MNPPATISASLREDRSAAERLITVGRPFKAGIEDPATTTVAERRLNPGVRARLSHSHFKRRSATPLRDAPFLLPAYRALKGPAKFSRPLRGHLSQATQPGENEPTSRIAGFSPHLPLILEREMKPQMNADRRRS